MQAPSAGLGMHRLPSDELKRLLRALHRGAVVSPVTRASLIEKGFGDIEGHLGLIVGKDAACARAVIVAVLGERSQGRRGPAQLSWLGPSLPGTCSRDLPLQVKELAFAAESRVELYGLSGIPEERELLESVRAAMRARGISVRLVFDGAESGASADALCALVAEVFSGSVPEVQRVRGPRLSMRAVIVDETRVLLTSGALSTVEEDGRIEAGTLLSDAEVVSALRREWQLLEASGRVERLL